MNNKTIAITYGDPEGIGLEILNFILKNELLPERYFCILGDKENLITIPDKYKKFIEIVSLPNKTEKTGKHSFEYLRLSIEKCLQAKCAGLVTGPISKARWAECGIHYTGQTELLSAMTNREGEMLFLADDLKVLLLTRHIPLRQVPDAVSWERLKKANETLRDFLKRVYKLPEPSIALSSINPHAGDGGSIGTEELDYLNQWCLKLNIQGAFSPDDIWITAAKKYILKEKQPFSAYIATYHDQILPLLKVITNFQAVNVSIGLPFIRTSPDHGTAFALVGKRQADHKPFLTAIETCINLVDIENFMNM